jgi:hypothetical protein
LIYAMARRIQWRFEMNYPVMATAFLAVSACAFGQQLVVTAEGHHGDAPPEVIKDDVSVEVNRRPAQVEKWIPLRGDQAGLELYIAIDEGEDTLPGQPFQKPEGLYARSARHHADRPRVPEERRGEYSCASDNRPRPGRESASPSYRGTWRLSQSLHGIPDLVKKWAVSGTRREVLLINRGIDPYYSPPDPQNPYLQKAMGARHKSEGWLTQAARVSSQKSSNL